MSIEFLRLAHPFIRDHGNSLPALVADGAVKRQAAKEAGLPFLSLPREVTDRTSAAEEELHAYIDGFGGLLVGFYKPYVDLPPRPVLATAAKSGRLAGWSRLIGDISYFTTDCLWVVDLTPGVSEDSEISELQLCVNKPRADRRGREQLLQLIYHGAEIGAGLINSSGISVYDPGSQKLTLGLIEVDLGRLKPNIDMGLLESQVVENGHISAGFNTMFALKHLTAPPMITVRFTRWFIDLDKPEQFDLSWFQRQERSGIFLRPDSSLLVHSPDPVNWAVYLLTLGAVPMR